MVLAAETIEREVFPGLQLNGIVDVSFQGFIKVVDTLGCAYVNVDHRYYNENVGSTETDYTSINLQPGYQKLCYENALDYVRYRHTDSDFVRVARQQDFLRDLREQISPGNELGQIDTVAKAVGHAISIDLPRLRQRADRTRQADRLLPGQAAAPGQVPHDQRRLPAQRRLLRDHHARSSSRRRWRTSCTATNSVSLPAPAPPAHASRHGHHSQHAAAPRARLTCSRPARPATSEVARAALAVPFPVLYPTLQTGQAEQQQVRPYTLLDQQGDLHHAYVVVWHQNAIGGYYDFEGTDWLNPPLFAHARIADDRRALLPARRRRLAHPRHRLALGQRALLADEHAARGTLKRADARARRLGAPAALSSLGARDRAAQSSVRASAGCARLVQRGVDERVGARVLRARHRPDRPALEARERGHRLLGAARASPRA